MRRQVANAVAPFGRRIGACGAVPAGTILTLAATAAALFNDLLAYPAFVAASFGCHEGAFYSWFNAGASHGNHPLSFIHLDLVMQAVRIG
jgi:hypothetical protein